MIAINTGIAARLIAEHPEAQPMLEKRGCNAIFQWMLRTLHTDQGLADGAASMTAVAKLAINECPLVKAETEQEWFAVCGNAWDAAHCYTLLVEMGDA